jgi:hypothetical protein
VLWNDSYIHIFKKNTFGPNTFISQITTHKQSIYVKPIIHNSIAMFSLKPNTLFELGSSVPQADVMSTAPGHGIIV